MGLVWSLKVPHAPPPQATLLWSLGVREVVDSRPARDNSKESFSSNQETGKVFSLLFQILKYVVPVGKCKLQTICVSLLWGVQPR